MQKLYHRVRLLAGSMLALHLTCSTVLASGPLVNLSVSSSAVWFENSVQVTASFNTAYGLPESYCYIEQEPWLQIWAGSTLVAEGTPKAENNYSITGSYSANGPGTIMFWGYSACDDSYSDAVNVDFIRIVVQPESGSVMSQCQPGGGTVQFWLASGTYAPGGVTWSITPTPPTSPTPPDGATIDSSGLVTLGILAQSYTVKATSARNGGCSDLVSLAVTLQSDCGSHSFTAQPQWVPFPLPEDFCGTCGLNGCWTGDVQHLSGIGQVLELSCCGSVYYNLDGNPVGHCPYGGSNIEVGYENCVCTAAIMVTAFRVRHDRNGGDGPGLNAGKRELWYCGDALPIDPYYWITPECFNSDDSYRTPNTGDFGSAGFGSWDDYTLYY